MFIYFGEAYIQVENIESIRKLNTRGVGSSYILQITVSSGNRLEYFTTEEDRNERLKELSDEIGFELEED
jgi:hypothetical protein